MTKPGFQQRTRVIALDRILPTRTLSKEVRNTQKFRTILASIREVGIVEPLAVHADRQKGKGDQTYILLDGHLRFEALRALDATEAICLISTDDEGFTYNRRINRLSAVQEHRMILQAIAKGVAPERIAQALNVDVGRIRERQRLLQGIAPEAVELLKDRMVSRGVFAVLRKMKPIRQIEAAEMMTSANRFTVPYAKMIHAATREELLVEPKKTKQVDATPEDIARMERQMEKLYQDYKLVEDTLGETMLVLVVAKGYVARLMRNENVSAYLDRHHPDLARELSAVMAAVASEARAPGRE
jgi:RepB plasmid partitioning protein/ParB-like nuclease domain